MILYISLEQRETIFNLYKSGITPDIIALQMDLNQEDVLAIIHETNINETNKKNSQKRQRDSPLLSGLYLDTIVNVDLAIKQAQSRIWQALKVKPQFNISMEETQNILESYEGSKVTLVVLYIDLVESTRLSMMLPIDRLATIIQAFTQEMSMLIEAYGGFILKYVGDAILAFFVVPDYEKEGFKANAYLPSLNAVNCACSMIKVNREGINPILNQYDYPELKVRIGIDIGENVVVQYGWDTYNRNGKEIMKKAHLDALGYTINIATKMTGLAKPDQIVIGQMVYDLLDEKQKLAFKSLSVTPDMWNYVSDYAGGRIYDLYGSINRKFDVPYKDVNNGK
ncbi:MAG TPA: adenylate/guanylate cyclase domain-containing protein [Nitrososphaeraceae archaeon]